MALESFTWKYEIILLKLDYFDIIEHRVKLWLDFMCMGYSGTVYNWVSILPPQGGLRVHACTRKLKHWHLRSFHSVLFWNKCISKMHCSMIVFRKSYWHKQFLFYDFISMGANCFHTGSATPDFPRNYWIHLWNALHYFRTWLWYI